MPLELSIDNALEGEFIEGDRLGQPPSPLMSEYAGPCHQDGHLLRRNFSLPFVDALVYTAKITGVKYIHRRWYDSLAP